MRNKSITTLRAISAFLLIPATAALAGCGNEDHSNHGHAMSESSKGHLETSAVEGAVISEEVFEAYFTIQEALAADSMDGIAEAAGTIQESLDISAVQNLKKVEEIEAVRKHFDELSQHLIAHLKMNGVDDQNHNLAFCPMAFNNSGASWLQRDSELANPYFGARMLRCGTFQEL